LDTISPYDGPKKAVIRLLETLEFLPSRKCDKSKAVLMNRPDHDYLEQRIARLSE
jgi:hypothetical protein